MMKSRKSTNVSLKGLVNGFGEAGRNMTPAPSKRVRNAESLVISFAKGFNEAGKFMANRH